MIDLAAKALIAAGTAALLFGAWQWREHVVYQRGVVATVAIAQRAASAAETKNKATAATRDAAASAADARHTQRIATLEAANAEQIAARAADRSLIARLRSTAVAGDRRAPVDAVDTCSAGHQQSDQRIDRLLAEGQRLGIEGSELVAEGRGLVAEGAGRVAGSASLIELARDWAKAVKLGEAAAPR